MAVNADGIEKDMTFSISSELSAKKYGEVPKSANKKVLTPRKLRVLAAVIYGNLFLGSCYSLMAPIFPAEAERKHASATAYGLVFGVYQLVMFLSAPVYGKLVINLKPGFMMKTGMFVSGICTIIFGFLHHAPNGNSFIGLAIAIRSVDALGASAFLTASYTTIGSELPEIIGRAMSLTETAFAFGLAGGPVLGGILYEAGGFRLPFMVVGALLLSGTAVNMFLFAESGAEIPPQSSSLRKLIANIDFLIDITAVFTCFAIIGFNEATLEPHIRQFHLTPTIIGTIFLIAGIVDALASPLFGYCAEKLNNAQYLTLIGCVMFTVCFIIIGPVPFLTFPTYLSVVIVSQFLLGLGMAAKIVCSFTHGMKHTVERGFPDDVGTYGIVSGVLFSAACFGAFVGPSLGGILIDHFGYKHSTYFVVVMEVIMALGCAVRLSVLYSKGKGKNPEPEGKVSDKI